MMKLYAVRDVKAESYGPPMASATEGLARRGFLEACADPRSDLYKYPSDYMLYELGDYNPQSGEIIPCTPKFVMNATRLNKANFPPEEGTEKATFPKVCHVAHDDKDDAEKCPTCNGEQEAN